MKAILASCHDCIILLLINLIMFNTEFVLLPHKERNSFPLEFVEEYFRMLVEKDVEWEKRRKMKQQLSIQWQKSWKLYRLAKTVCWSDDDVSKVMMLRTNLMIGKYLINYEVFQLYSMLRKRLQTLIQLLFLKEKMV